MTRTLNIAGRLHTIADDGVLISSDELLDERKNKKQNVVNADVDSALADRYTKSEVYTKQEVNNLVSPNQNYVTVAEFTDLPISGATDTIYRVSSWDGSLSTPAVDVTKYSEYAWDDTGYVFLCVKTQIGEVYDISAANSGAKYADLSAALGVDGGNVPSEIRRGGMSVKFVQSSDNKYVQYRLMADSFSITDADWQGVDEEPTAGSDNLVKSGGVANKLAELAHDVHSKIGGSNPISIEFNVGKFIAQNGSIESSSAMQYSKPFMLGIGQSISVHAKTSRNAITVAKVVTEDSVYLSLAKSSSPDFDFEDIVYTNNSDEIIKVAICGAIDGFSAKIIYQPIFINKSNIVDDLTTGGTLSVLSAEQGKKLNENTSIDEEFIFVLGSYIDENGNLKGGGESWFSTDKQFVNEGQKINYDLEVVTGLTYIACYDINDEFVASSSLISHDSSYVRRKGEFIVPKGISYIRCSTHVYDSKKAFIRTSIKDKTKEIEREVSIIKNLTYKETDVEFIIGRYILISDGKDYGGGVSWKYTDFYSVKEGDIINYDMSAKQDAAMIACYDSSKGYIKSASIEKNGQIKDTFYVPKGVSYVRMCGYTTSGVCEAKIINSKIYIPSKIYNIEDSNDYTFCGACNTILRAFYESNPKQKIVFMSYIFKGLRNVPDTSEVYKLQKAIADYWGTQFIDVYAKTGIYWRNQNDQNAYQWMTDGVHSAAVYEGDDFTINRAIARYIASEIKPLFDDWTGKKILWFGTSATSGYPKGVNYSYVKFVDDILGSVSTNKGVGGSTIKYKKVDGTIIENSLMNPQSNVYYGNFVNSISDFDLVIIDHGINDYINDGTEFDISKWKC